jgi:hypothetical protein
MKNGVTVAEVTHVYRDGIMNMAVEGLGIGNLAISVKTNDSPAEIPKRFSSSTNLEQYITSPCSNSDECEVKFQIFSKTDSFQILSHSLIILRFDDVWP